MQFQTTHKIQNTNSNRKTHNIEFQITKTHIFQVNTKTNMKI